MKETKITKRIFAVFVAFIVILLISCGDLQVFAESSSFSFYFKKEGGRNIFETRVFSYSDVNSNSLLLKEFRNNSTDPLLVSVNYTSPVYCFSFLTFYNSSWTNSVPIYYIDSSNVEHLLSVDKSNPTLLDSSFTYTFVAKPAYYHNSLVNYYFTFEQPTPEPTATPVPTPTPEPTFNPDQPTYTTFFNHLLNDGNNALNALYLSWTQANNKFYTGIFFIGLPIMIGIFGIVASIFFGGDD